MNKNIIKLIFMLAVAAGLLAILVMVEQSTEKNYGYVRTVKEAQGVPMK